MKVKKTKYYKDLKVPAYLFFDILETNDLRLLIIKGEPKEGKLKKAFSRIFDLYYEVKNDGKLKLILKTKKNIIKLYGKIGMLECVVLSLVQFTFPEDKVKGLIEGLRKGGINIDESVDLDSELLRVLQTDLAGYKTHLALEEHNLKELTKGEKSSFEDSLAALEDVHNRPMDENMSLAMYLARQKSAKEKVKSSNKTAN